MDNRFSKKKKYRRYER